MNTNQDHGCKQGLICLDCKLLFCKKCENASDHKDHINFKTKQIIKNSVNNCHKRLRDSVKLESIKEKIKILRQQAKSLKKSTQKIQLIQESETILPEILQLEQFQRGLQQTLIKKQNETPLDIFQHQNILVKILQENLEQQRENSTLPVEQNNQKQNPPPKKESKIFFKFKIQSQNQNQQIDKIPQDSRNEQQYRNIIQQTQMGRYQEILQIPKNREQLLILDQQDNLVLYNYINSITVERFAQKFQQIRINNQYMIAYDLDDYFIIYDINNFKKKLSKIYCKTSYYQILPNNQIAYVQGKYLNILDWPQKLTKKYYEDQQEIISFLVYQRYNSIVVHLTQGFKVINLKTQQIKNYSEQPQTKNIQELKYLNEENLIIIHREMIHLFNIQFQTFSNSIWIGQFSFIKPILNTEYIFIVQNDFQESLSQIQLKDLGNENTKYIIKKGAQSIYMNEQKDVIILKDLQGKIQKLRVKDI